MNRSIHDMLTVTSLVRSVVASFYSTVVKSNFAMRMNVCSSSISLSVAVIKHCLCTLLLHQLCIFHRWLGGCIVPLCSGILHKI